MIRPKMAGTIKLIIQSPNVAVKAVTLSTPADVQTKMANSPLANTLTNAGNGISV